jgi:hypothetical protein
MYLAGEAHFRRAATSFYHRPYQYFDARHA